MQLGRQTYDNSSYDVGSYNDSYDDIYESRSGGGTAFALISGILIGAGFMYLLDSGRGAQRRAYVRDKFIRAGHLLARRANGQFRNLGNHLRGSVLEARSKMRDRMRNIPDDTLVERARAQLGHVVSHPRALYIEAEDGCVFVSGGVMRGEIQQIEQRLRETRGVRDFRLMLSEYDDPNQLSQSQGGDWYSMREGFREEEEDIAGTGDQRIAG